MKDEIKEILKKLNYNAQHYILYDYEVSILKDYITNLKQIEQDHKEMNATLMSELAKLEEKNERLKFQLEYQQIISSKYRMRKNIYKSRCEKASDKMQYIIDYGFDYDGFNTVESLKGLIDMLVNYARESKNILQKGSEDNEYE